MESKTDFYTMRTGRFMGVAIMILANLPLAALETTLEWRVGKEIVILYESLRPRSSGYEAFISTSKGEQDILILDGRRSTLEWRRKFDSEGTDLAAIRVGKEVRIRGTYKGKPYEKKYDFGDIPWYQFQEISYEELYASGAATGAATGPATGVNSASFWTIDRSSLKPSLFVAHKKGNTVIDVMGKPIEAIEYHLTISGVPAFVFTAVFWLRKSDGRFLRLDVPPILGLPRSRVDLTSESE
jgi:hypothetical protein